MDWKELIKAGRLAEARSLLVENVKAKPGDTASRTVLFQVLSIQGEWDRAERHLDVLASQSPSAEIGAQLYKNIITAERERESVFAHGHRPSVLPSAPAWFELVFSAWERLTEGQTAEARTLFEQIEAQSREVCGTLGGKTFSGFRDTDARLAFFLEVVVHDRYIWVPLESIRELSVPVPRTLLDLLWAPARITTRDGLSLACFLFVVYPGSSRHKDDRVKMGGMTDWVPPGGKFAIGMGQHVFQVGDEELGILELGEVEFTLPGRDGTL